jgi:hypothetical protein
MMKWFFDMLSSLVLVLALAATSQTASTPAEKSPPASIPTCSTVTRFQIETAIGQHVGQGMEEHSELACTTTYSTDDIAVTISIQHFAKPLDLAAEIESLKTAFPSSRLSEVKGIAEHAFALEIPGAGTQLHVLPDGSAYLLVSVLGLSDADHGFNAAMKIARDLMGKQ